jgi:hypothetical protein
MMILGPSYNVRKPVAKPIVEQNGNTGVFSQGDFSQDPAECGQADLRRDRAFN